MDKFNCSHPVTNRRKVLAVLIFIVIAFIAYIRMSYFAVPFVEHIAIESEALLLPTTMNQSNWIVITTISLPTEDIKKLASISDWQVVVVGDKKTPDNWTFSGVVYLDISQQKQLGYKIVDKLPYNSYTRKMIGYLYAIQNGAKYIYDTDDDNHPSEGKIDFHLDSTMSGLIYDDLSHKIVNPLSHFGQDIIWPRGYPLDYVSMKANKSYQLCTFNTPAIQQGLVNGDPDVDAIYRLINRGSDQSKNINVTFDIHAPPMVLPKGVFAPFNSQNTLFSYEAFWALFLPVTVDFRVTDIWRGYWAQRLLWLIGQYLAFFAPNAVQYRNPHSYLADFGEEIQMYKEAGNFVGFLSDWKCTQSSFYECILNLTSAMVERNYVKSEDLELVKLFLGDLKTIGYEEPKLVSLDLNQMCIETESSNWVYYSPPVPQPNHGFRDLVTLCEDNFQNSSFNKEDFSAYLHPTSPKLPQHVFDNLLLVVVFNFPHIDNIRLLEAVYRDHFPNMLFCSETKTLDGMLSQVNSGKFKWRKNDITFLNITSNGGWFGYECTMRAIEMNYKVDGYMVLADDMMFKFWDIYDFDVGRNYNQNDVLDKMRFVNRSLEQYSWQWWGSDIGRAAINRAFDEIIHMAESKSHPKAELYQQFIENHYANDLNMSTVAIAWSDFYYVSANTAKLYLEIAKVFLKNKVFLEIAVPTLASGCEEDNHLDNGFPGVSLWGGGRDDPFTYFTNATIYLHPMKLAPLMTNPELFKSYCNNYTLDFLDNW